MGGTFKRGRNALCKMARRSASGHDPDTVIWGRAVGAAAAPQSLGPRPGFGPGLLTGNGGRPTFRRTGSCFTIVPAHVNLGPGFLRQLA